MKSSFEQEETVVCSVCGDEVLQQHAIGIVVAYAFGMSEVKESVPHQVFCLCAPCVSEGYVWWLDPDKGMSVTRMSVNIVDIPVSQGDGHESSSMTLWRQEHEPQINDGITKIMVTFGDNITMIPAQQGELFSFAPPLEDDSDEEEDDQEEQDWF